MGVLSWFILGIAAGWVACRISGRTRTKDLLANMVVGVLGAFAGGFTANLVGFDPPFDFTATSFIVAVLGTVVFLGIFGAVQRR